MSEHAQARISTSTLVLMVGTVVQTLVALITVPLYLSVLGQERFGAYIVAGLIFSYFALLDRGLNAAVQNEVAGLGNEARSRSPVVWTAASLNLVVGVVAGAAVLAVGWIVFGHVVSLESGLTSEVYTSLIPIALCLPVYTVSAVFQGALLGREHFVTVSVLETIRIVLLQLLPLAAAVWIGPQLVWVSSGGCLALVLSGLLFLGAALWLVLRPRFVAWPVRETAVRLFHYGKWITLTAALTPLLDMTDRLVIGAMRGASAVTVYTIPYNFASRLVIVPFSLVRAMFPRLSSVDAGEARSLTARALEALAAITAPFAVLGSILVTPFFALWLGGSIAHPAAQIGSILFAAFWINGLGYIPVTLLQAQGRPDLPARLHILEVVPFLVVLCVGIYFGGVLGAAVAWLIRVAVDTTIMLTIAGIHWFRNRGLIATAMVVAAAAVLGAIVGSETWLLLAIGVPLVVLSLVCAWVVSPPEAREFVRRKLGRGDAEARAPA